MSAEKISKDELQKKFFIKLGTTIAVQLIQPFAAKRALKRLGYDFSYSEVYAMATLLGYAAKTATFSVAHAQKEWRELVELTEAVANG